MKKIFFIFTLCMGLFSRAAEDLFTPSVGFGLNSLHMTVNTDTSYTPTNTNYYFVSLGYKGFSFQAKYPQLDPEESRKSRVDSKIQDYQISLDVYRNWKAAFYYQNYKGYFVENKLIQFGISQPDLSFNHIGTQVFYVFNEKHSSFLVQDTYWDQVEDTGSWLLSAGVDQFTINGDLIPVQLKLNKDQILQKLNVNTYSLRFGYSQNWVWTHWFAGAAFGVGYNVNQIQATYVDQYIPPNTTTNTTHLNSLFAFSTGYKWVTSKVGLFARVFSWNMEFDNIEITSNTSTTGLYYSTTF